MTFNKIRMELHFAIWNNDKKYWSLEKIRRNMYNNKLRESMF